MVHDQIRYDILVQDALRSVIRKVLSEVAKAGLPGDHHFFITFLTNAPGVKISSRLKERYPEQMTIVLQHQFWDLNVSETGFEVNLSFGDVPERLVIPFSAVQVFYDPIAAFEAAFDLTSDLLQSDNDSDEDKAIPAPDKKAELSVFTDKKSKKKSAIKLKASEKLEQIKEAHQATSKQKKPSADVVSLDAFRKK
ncbi:ClpXP protease specificity-enhancing factor SspB [uncultured Bartonella sp.]|uniref:SspB family protein n=1 Tax=uncultured Bartonella sp. TaxID=104108 RepID=UPI0026338D89|nr:ClpXP protease specificity-enhancing factor SspB [uncultured Bartonella sp.]